MPIWCVYQKNDEVSTHGKTLERVFEKKEHSVGGYVVSDRIAVVDQEGT